MTGIKTKRSQESEVIPQISISAIKHLRLFLKQMFWSERKAKSIITGQSGSEMNVSYTQTHCFKKKVHFLQKWFGFFFFTSFWGVEKGRGQKAVPSTPIFLIRQCVMTVWFWYLMLQLQGFLECTLPLISDFKTSIQQLENGSLMNYHSSSAQFFTKISFSDLDNLV